MIQIGCRKHPSYTANRIPTGDCFECRILWHAVQHEPDAPGEVLFKMPWYRFRPGVPRVRPPRHG